MLLLGFVCGALFVVPVYHLVFHRSLSPLDGASFAVALAVAALAFVVRRRI